MGQTGASNLASSMQSSWEVLGVELGEQQGVRAGVGMVVGAGVGTFFAPVIGSIVGAAIGGFLGSLFGPSLDKRKQKYWDGLTPALDEYFAQLEKQTRTALDVYKKEIRAALKEHINSHVTRYKEVVEEMRQKQENELRQLQGLQNGVKQDLSGISRRRKTLKTKRKRLVKPAQR
jgi:gas vesicle protein